MPFGRVRDGLAIGDVQAAADSADVNWKYAYDDFNRHNRPRGFFFFAVLSAPPVARSVRPDPY